MREQGLYSKLIFTAVLIGFLSLVSVKAQDSIIINTQTISLGATAVKVNVYEKKGANVTFFAPHHNEQTGLRIAKELVAKKGGRLIEIESFDESGNPARQIKFLSGGKSYSIDPNRIFTENGRQCGGISPEINLVVKTLADSLLKIILVPGANKLRDGENFLVAVHNNSDVDERGEAAKGRDLTAYAFVKHTDASQFPHGAFQEQADGVYLSNAEEDEDNFIFLSTPSLISFFAEKGFNVVVQKSAAKLLSKKCSVDDGSLSVFSGQQNIPYINIEADVKNGGFRQRQMLESVYELLQKTDRREPEKMIAAVGK